MRLKALPLLFLALSLASCGGGFDTGIRRGLTASKITYEGAMDAVDITDRAGRIDAAAAGIILGYEERHRTIHNMTIAMTEQYVKMRELGQSEEQLLTLEEQIRGYQTATVLLVAEFIVFLQEIGVM